MPVFLQLIGWMDFRLFWIEIFIWIFLLPLTAMKFQTELKKTSRKYNKFQSNIQMALEIKLEFRAMKPFENRSLKD